MKFFHLSDLHIGRQLHGYSLKEDQEQVLKEVIQYARELHPDAVLIAGDIYDKSVPSAEAVAVFNRFLTDLSEIRPQIPVMIIAGNHDSAERLEFAAAILEREKVYLAGSPPGTPEELIQRVTLQDEFGPVHFYLLPFLRPGAVKGALSGELKPGYQEAYEALLARETVCTEERNVVISHQFFSKGQALAETCDSESFSIGGIENIDVSVLEPFDYAALGHIHGAQRIGEDYFRYCGTILKYSVSESNHRKGLTEVTLGRKGMAPEIRVYPLHPIRDVVVLKGTLEEILHTSPEDHVHNYVSITLTDEVDPVHPKERLEERFDHILEIRVDNARTRKKLIESGEEIMHMDPGTAFTEFFREIHDRDMTEEEHDLLLSVIQEAKGEQEL